MVLIAGTYVFYSRQNTDYSLDEGGKPYYRYEAPDGVYHQLDTGYFSSNTTWYFALCGHTYLGPLHGEWNMTEGIIGNFKLKKIGNAFDIDWQAYPDHAKLYIRLENNVITDAWME